MAFIVMLQDAMDVRCHYDMLSSYDGGYVGDHAGEACLALFMNSVIVTNIARLYSYASILCSAVLVAVRPGRPPHCSSVSSVCSDFAIRCLEK